MVCQGLEVLEQTGINGTIAGIMAYPTTCDYHFYTKILIGIFLILTLALFFKDEDKRGVGELISSAGVSALAVIVIALFGTLAKFIQQDVFIMILVGGLVFIVMWLIKKDR